MDGHKDKLFGIERQHVLIVCEGNQFLRVFSDKDVQIRFAEVPFFEDPKGELLVENFLELRLPHLWKQVLSDGKLVGIHPIRKTTAGAIALRDFDIEISKCFDRVQAILHGGAK